VQRDWPESCFGARNCDELPSNFLGNFLVPVSGACVTGIRLLKITVTTGTISSVVVVISDALNTKLAYLLTMTHIYSQFSQSESYLTPTPGYDHLL